MNPSRVHLESFLREFASSLPKGSRVLDAGAGDCRHKVFFEEHRYEATDFAEVPGKTYGKLDFVGDLTDLPVADDTYDAIICTQVLAHLPEPMKALSELRRVLKPGGRIALTCPLFFHENEPPYDFFRYTRYGIAKVFEASGFEIESLEWLEGYFGTLAYQLRMAGRSLPWFPPNLRATGAMGIIGCLTFCWLKPLFLGVGELLARLDVRSKWMDRGMCKNYRVVAKARVEPDSQ